MKNFRLTIGDGPILAAAIHAGHELRPKIAQQIALDDATRLREEDPFTDELAELAPSHIVGCRSRFEVDLNRSRDQAVYRRPQDSWGLVVWRDELSPSIIVQSWALYDLFYATVHTVLQQLIYQNGRIVVLDVHSYNHRREWHDCVDDEADSPEINIGTGSMDRSAWEPVVDRVIADLRQYKVSGHCLDVRENVKFYGGHFPQWINATFPGEACAIALEFKKTFMDEWTGELDRPQFCKLQAALSAIFPGILETLATTKPGHMALSDGALRPAQ